MRLFRRDFGFTLIELAVVIVVLSLLLAMIAGIATAMLGQQRREATRQRLAGVETAIALFVSQNKRLPCPADGIVPGTTNGAGVEARNPTNGACTTEGGDNTQTNGVVPWRTLGLAEPDVTDGWGNRLTYRVAPELAKYPNNVIARGAMDFTSCDPGGTPFNPPASINPNLDLTYGLFCRSDCNSAGFPDACTPPSTYTAGKGLKIRNLTSATLIMNPAASPSSTGAAYVVISHGENGTGSYNNQGIRQEGTVASGTLEGDNNESDVPFTGATSGATPVLVDDFPSYLADTNHFDDFVLRPSILTVATKAQLGPRAH